MILRTCEARKRPVFLKSRCERSVNRTIEVWYNHKSDGGIASYHKIVSDLYVGGIYNDFFRLKKILKNDFDRPEGLILYMCMFWMNMLLHTRFYSQIFAGLGNMTIVIVI